MKSRAISIIKAIRPVGIDWKLLVFLLLFLNVKLIIKIAAVVLMYLVRPNFRFGFSLKNSRLPLFYILAPGIAVLNWVIIGNWSNFNYGLVLLTGILFWVLCILAIHQVKLSVEKYDPEIIHRTILVFFILNAAFSLLTFTGIILETGSINPYRYQGNFQKYFIGTGDYIKGISFDTSTTNAVLNAFGVIYFLLRGKNALVILCMAVLLLAGSNMTNILLCCTLLYVFIFQSSRHQKSMIVVCFIMLACFLIKISPENNKYVITAYERFFNIKRNVKPDAKHDIPITQKPDSILNTEERKQKIAQLYMDSVNLSLVVKNEYGSMAGSISSLTGFKEKPEIPKDSIHTPSFQHRNDTNAIEEKLLQFVGTHNKEVPISSGVVKRPKLPGKLVTLQQTVTFFRQHPYRLLTGTGIGNFSSKLAFRATSMKVTGSYPARFTYISDDFKSNHLDLYLYYFTDKDDYHSVANSPNSTYDQLLSEYGLAGLFSFAFFYIAFFAKQLKQRSIAIPILLFMLGIFFIEYWFEQLSVVIFFELLLLLNIKETTVTQNQ